MDVVYFDIGMNGEVIGRLVIELYRDCFPDAVENFLRIAEGKTSRSEQRTGYIRQTDRSYKGTRFFKMAHNQYIMGGDIYQNDGTSAGTIYDDQPIPEIRPDYLIPHDQSGLISVVGYPSEEGIMYDSTFMITLGPQPDFDDTQVVIGSVKTGMHIIDMINKSLIPVAGRRYPLWHILDSGIMRNQVSVGKIIVYDRDSNGEIIVPQESYQSKRLEGAGRVRHLSLLPAY